jgi:phosphoesterase RecJ-like protein
MFVALSTDTGDFRYPNATARAFRAAAALTEAGAKPAQVAGWIHERRSEASIRLLGEALGTLELLEDGRLAVLAVDPAAFHRAGARPEDTEDLISAPRSIAGVEVVAFLKQWEPGVVRVSLRSKGRIDVCGVAALFGGGGHTNAAGCTIHGELAAARSEVIARLASVLSETS